MDTSLYRSDPRNKEFQSEFNILSPAQFCHFIRAIFFISPFTGVIRMFAHLDFQLEELFHFQKNKQKKHLNSC